jgi:hypothetical protein
MLCLDPQVLLHHGRVRAFRGLVWFLARRASGQQVVVLQEISSYASVLSTDMASHRALSGFGIRGRAS